MNNKKIMKYKRLGIVLLAFCANAFAVPEFYTTGKVTQILTHTQARNPYNVGSTGVLFLFVENLPASCETGAKRVAISSDHPLFDTVTSIALTAQSQNKEVRIGYLDSCTQNSSAWDFSYIRLYQE